MTTVSCGGYLILSQYSVQYDAYQLFDSSLTTTTVTTITCGGYLILSQNSVQYDTYQLFDGSLNNHSNNSDNNHLWWVSDPQPALCPGWRWPVAWWWRRQCWWWCCPWWSVGGSTALEPENETTPAPWHCQPTAFTDHREPQNNSNLLS